MSRATWIAENAFCVRCPAWHGELGSEPTPELFIEHLVLVFREVKRVLRRDGTLWVNMGDSFAGSGKGFGGADHGKLGKHANEFLPEPNGMAPGLKPKDLIGVPWMLAFALRADGWILRQEIVWDKPNCMPESVGDRCTKSHEQIFMLAKAKWSGPMPRRFASISDDDARWLALFLDTEGNICARRSKVKSGNDHFSTQICFASSNRPILAVTQKIIGAGAVLTRKGKNAPMYYLQMSCNQAADLLHRIYPFLIVKQRQARLAIYLQDVIARSGKERRTKEGQLRGRTRSDDYTAELVDIWAMMKSLNHFGEPDMALIPEPETGHWSDCERYFYDQEAIREPATSADHHNRYHEASKDYQQWSPPGQVRQGNAAMMGVNPSGRNKRSVWSINTSPFPGSHFATWPPELAETMMKAGTSEKGCCPICSSPWKRVVERGIPIKSGGGNTLGHADGPMNRGGKGQWDAGAIVTMTPSSTTGWEPSCKCCTTEPPVPCTILDPFAGSGTSLFVATKLGRRSIGIELNPSYAEMARQRCAQLGMSF
jgi:hypothetical protein